MGEEKARKGRSIALSGAIGFILVALMVGMLIGVALSFVVIAPFMQSFQQNNNYQGTDNNQNGNNNNNQGPSGTPSMSNNNPSITSPTSQYSSVGSQFSVSITDQNGKTSGTISADVNCAVQQNGNNIQLDLTITPTTIPQSLSQMMDKSPVTLNFVGSISGSQINAEATGTTGQNNEANFDFNLNGSFSSNALTLTINSDSNSQISMSTPHSITLQSI
jgi:hypothetical protein